MVDATMRHYSNASVEVDNVPVQGALRNGSRVPLSGIPRLALRRSSNFRHKLTIGAVLHIRVWLHVSTVNHLWPGLSTERGASPWAYEWNSETKKRGPITPKMVREWLPGYDCLPDLSRRIMAHTELMRITIARITRPVWAPAQA